MTALIHMLSVGEFKALAPEVRSGFLADIAAEWVGAGEDGETAMPDSYSRLFERRVAQEAALRGSNAADTMADILAQAEALDAAGETAMAHMLPGALDALWINEPVEATEAPTAPPKPRAPRKPKVVADPAPEATAPTVEPDPEPETVDEPPTEVEPEPETPSLDPAEAPTESEPETQEPVEDPEPTHLDDAAEAIQAMVAPDASVIVLDIAAHRAAAAEAVWP